MADVFISYSREDQARARAIADALEARGLSVWWDRHATPGVPFDEEIEAQLARSRCALVLWSAHSTASAWVRQPLPSAASCWRVQPRHHLRSAERGSRRHRMAHTRRDVRLSVLPVARA
jgi:hypothetical protein